MAKMDSSLEYDFSRSIMPSIEAVIDWMQQNLEPDDVFLKDQLELWAVENGFEKKE